MVGNQTRVKVVKNKVAPPFKQVEFDIMYGEGISKVGELIDLGVKAGVVEKSGAWFSYDSVRLGQGRENSKAFLKSQSGDGRQDRARHSREFRADRRAYPRRGSPVRRRRRRRSLIGLLWARLATHREQARPSAKEVPLASSGVRGGRESGHLPPLSRPPFLKHGLRPAWSAAGPE